MKELNLKQQANDPKSLIPRMVADLHLDTQLIGLTSQFLKIYLPRISINGKILNF
ncbi:hypothetical protein LCGC14_1376010 [marine sediment metagenome]|uniref:Uncharacterized protein n=1 Tax=marine sediment metagenome TaxID=412755 RepID=A0A0F9K438_9ZZZZ